MGCSKQDTVSNKSIGQKIGFYSLRTLIFSLSLILTPLIFLLIIVVLFNQIVLNKCAKDNFLINLMKKNNKKDSPFSGDEMEEIELET